MHDAPESIYIICDDSDGFRGFQYRLLACQRLIADIARRQLMLDISFIYQICRLI